MRRTIRYALLLLTLLGAAFAWIWSDSRTALNLPLQLGNAVMQLSVPAGANFSTVVADLANAKVLDCPRYLVWEARRLGLANKMKAGDYELKPGTTALDLLDQLVKGRGVQYTFTIVEGSTVREILKRLEEHPHVTHTLQNVTTAALLQRIGRAGDNPEGLFFPDTYKFSQAAADIDVLRSAYDRMTEKLSSAWAGRDADLPYNSAYDALIMASIVEKETAQSAERPQIAGVFVRRLRMGMLLQTDPTVIYALGEQFDGNLRRNDLQVDSPYNTYRYKGLTPSPIGAAGDAAIAAALHPVINDALYFVARGDGSHKFSANLDEHKQAVSQFQRAGH